MTPFQIIFTPTSAAELARMPKELQLQILGEFRGLPQQVIGTELDDFGKFERGGRTLHRFRVGTTAFILSGTTWACWCTGFSAATRSRISSIVPD